MLQRIEVDLHKIQERSLALRSKARVQVDVRQHDRNRPLNESDRYQRLRIGRLDRRRLAARPFIGQLLAKMLVLQQML